MHQEKPATSKFPITTYKRQQNKVKKPAPILNNTRITSDPHVQDFNLISKEIIKVATSPKKQYKITSVSRQKETLIA